MFRLFPIVVLLLFCSKVLAQSSFGLKAGFNLTRITVSQPVDPTFDNTWKPSFHIGGFLHKPLSKGAAIQVELLYSEKGGKLKQGTGDDAIQLRYINVPVLLNLQLADGLVLEVGPELGYLLSPGRRSIYNSIDLGLDGGLRYRLTKTVDVELRYNYGLSSLASYSFTNASGVNNGPTTLRNEAFQVSISYNLNN